jgi:hypothetical protein
MAERADMSGMCLHKSMAVASSPVRDIVVLPHICIHANAFD